jgi:hypothetical protein
MWLNELIYSYRGKIMKAFIQLLIIVTMFGFLGATLLKVASVPKAVRVDVATTIINGIY